MTPQNATQKELTAKSEATQHPKIFTLKFGWVKIMSYLCSVKGEQQSPEAKKETINNN